MKILVTGHEGYIGTTVVRRLMSEGHMVAGLDSGLFSECGLPLSSEPVPEWKKDLRDVEMSDLSGFDAVIHLAALSNDPLGDIAPELTMAINHHASVRLAELARDAGIRRFIFASTCSIYGSRNSDEVLTEATPLRPMTPYAVSKVYAEEDLARLADRDFSPVFLRFATAYGLSPRLRGDVVLNNLVGWAHTTGRIRLLSDGSPWRPIVHVEDIGNAIGACLRVRCETLRNEAINIGLNDENYQVRDLAEIVREAVPGSVVEYAGGLDLDARSYRVDFSKAVRLLPTFHPIWNARLGAAQVYRCMKVHRIDRQTFLGPKFVRVAHLRQVLGIGAVDADLRWRGGVA
jgi:nucleoside-diphosphate-sugar epimerase